MFEIISNLCTGLSITSKVAEVAEVAEKATDFVGLDSASEVFETVKDTAESLQEYCPVNIIKEKIFDE